MHIKIGPASVLVTPKQVLADHTFLRTRFPKSVLNLQIGKLEGVQKPKSGFKVVDYVQGQGVRRIESGAYTPVREHFNSRDNAAIGH
jgi:hypothetical protein